MAPMQPPAQHPLDFRALGPVEAVRNGESLPLGGPRQRTLLALLLLDPGAPISAERIADELWRDGSPPASSTTIRSNVSRLRSALGPTAPIVNPGPGYELRVPAESIDVHRFERIVREGQDALAAGWPERATELLAAATDLWRGEPFAGALETPTLTLEAERLAELRLLALEGRIEARLALGDDAALVPELESLASAHPHRERLWQHLMLALYRAGRQADALGAFRRARDYLDQELGLEPSGQLRQLEQAILRHEVPRAEPSVSRHPVPAPVTSFVGRASELSETERLLHEHRLLTLTGMGGVGKTRLALELAARASRARTDRVLFVDLAELVDPQLVPRHLARALDLREQPDRGPVDQLVECLERVDLLLVLDNCEHVRGAVADLCRLLLRACPRLRVLATSRETLGVPGEVDYSVPPLEVPPADAAPDELHSSEAVRLFVARAREARPRLAETPATIVAAARICRELDGLPLAIELAAGHAKALAPEEIAERLADRFAFLVAGRRPMAARHATLKEAMAWSYELLGADAQRLLARLSVFSGGFTLDAAADVCLDGDRTRALTLVERLVDASLVIAEDRDGEMRYRLLETVRQYAAERLEQAGATEELHRRHTQWAVALAETAEYELRRRHSLQTRLGSRLHAEHANLTAAIARSVETRSIETGLRIVAPLVRLWIERDYVGEADRWLRLLLDHAEAEPQLLRAKAYVAAWNLASVRGDDARAERHARRAAELFASAPDEEGSAWGLLALGAMHEQRGEHAEGRQRLLEALEGHRRSRDEMGVRRSLHLLGNIARQDGDVDEARRLLGEALALAIAADDPFHQGGILHSLGDTELEGDKGEAAEALYQEAIAIGRRIGGYRIVTYCVAGLAAARAAHGDGAAAARLWPAALTLERTLGFRMRASVRSRYEQRLASLTQAGDAAAVSGCRTAEDIVAMVLPDLE